MAISLIRMNNKGQLIGLWRLESNVYKLQTSRTAQSQVLSQSQVLARGCLFIIVNFNGGHCRWLLISSKERVS